MIKENKNNVYICIDAGGTFLKSIVSDKEGYPLDTIFTIPINSNGAKDEVLEGFYTIIKHGLDVIEKNRVQLSGIGFAFPGPFDYRNGIPMMKHKFQDIYGINLHQYFLGIDGIPENTPIHFLHDVEAVLQGEMWKGYGRDYFNTAIVTLGTGLGFSFCKEGVVQRNDLGGPVLSLFKLPYGTGILEDYVSKRGLLKIYEEINGKHINSLTVADIGTLADNGDKKAVATFLKAGKILAGALSNILKTENIECLLFGGQISKSFRHLETSLKKELKDISNLKMIAPVKNIDLAAFQGILRLIAYSDFPDRRKAFT